MSTPLVERPLPPPTLAALYPPIRGYRYFEVRTAWPFAAGLAPADPRAIWWMAEHALLAYEQPAQVQAELMSLGYQAHCIEDSGSSGFAYAALAADHGVLAFRGTEAMTPGDSLSKLGSVARDWLIDASVRRVDHAHGGRVHGGFARALDALWPQIQPLLSAAPVWWCSGHSLGGALAALAALRIAADGRLAGAVSFGQPAVGDAACAEGLDRLPLLRVVNACDVVPDLPPKLLGFRHGGRLLHLHAHRADHYASTVRRHLARLPGNLRHGIGALTPIELIDHAPLHYVVKCFNAALAATS